MHVAGRRKGNGCFEKRDGKDMCNITRLAILGLTTGHGYQRLPVTTSYPTIAAPSSTSWFDSSSVWEAVAGWHDGQH